MVLRERSLISRPPDAVWPFIVTPELYRQWNDKIESIEMRERFGMGPSFTTHYLWKGKQMQCLSTVTRLEEGRLLEIRHTGCVGPSNRRDMEVIERVELKARGDGSVVTKTVTVRGHDIPLFLSALVCCITRFGKPVGPDLLKALCEREG